jgi:oligopeptidase B
MSLPSEKVLPPKAKKISRKITVHGKEVEDSYFWMRERDNPEVIAYLEAENAYTKEVMKDTEALQEKLYKEMLARIKETDLSVPIRLGDYFYYSRTEQGKQYSIKCRKKGSLEAAEEILLDLNALAQGHDYFRLGIFKVSPDQNLLAYSTDTTGAEMFTIRVKNLATGELLRDIIPNTYPNLEWAADNKNFFYVVLDAAKRPHQLMRHSLGTDGAKDEAVWQETDERFFLSIYKTKDRKFLMLDLSSKVTSEIHYLAADKPLDAFRLIHAREQNLEYSAEHFKGRFLILTNDQAKNFKLVEAPLETPGKAFWKDVIAARAEVKIEGLDLFEKHWVIYERESGLLKIRVRSLLSGSEHYLDFPETVYTAYGAGNPEFATGVLRFEYTSLVTPSSVFDYDMEARTRELKKQQEVLGGYDSSKFFTERIWALSHDGTRVPVSLVYAKGLKRDGSAPLYLYGYGSYGITMDPEFSSTRLSLLERGFVFAIAHIRGGSEMGRPWYEDGKFFKKTNTFLDFIAAAEHLIAEKYTSKDRLAACGGSAGGLLIGAVANMRPDLFKAVIAMVPFVDVVNTMLDASLPLTVTEYEEWGNPEDKSVFDCMLSYSPYDNVQRKEYPHMLITGGLNDPRVQYWEPAKWTAKLRDMKTGDNLLLLKMEMGSGHGGPSGRYEILKEIAFDYAFVFKVLNLFDKNEAIAEGGASR